MAMRKSRRIQTILVRAPSRRYPVFVGYQLLRRAGELLERVWPDCRRLFVISSPRVWSLWGDTFVAGLRPGGLHAEPLLMADREEKKSLATVEKLARALVRRGADRTARLAALGGGVVGDVTGFLAASFMRGVEYVQIPSTLVAQVDSAIGGKTGVNLGEGKNLLGAFHQPCAVLVDPQVLATLPAREFAAGLYEVIKYAVIGDTALFRFLERQLGAVKRRQPAALQYALQRCIRLKARVVARDEREQNLRRSLNFGHTFGHALEALTRYRGLCHGEAVGWGMIAATRLAERLGRLPPAEARRILSLVVATGRLPALPPLPTERILAQLYADKKKRGEALFFVLPRGIGRVEVTADVPRAALLSTLRSLSGASSCR